MKYCVFDDRTKDYLCCYYSILDNMIQSMEGADVNDSVSIRSQQPEGSQQHSETRHISLMLFVWEEMIFAAIRRSGGQEQY